MSIVGERFELLALKNNLAMMVEHLLTLRRRIFLVLQGERIQRRGLVNFLLARSACEAMIRIGAAPTLEHRIAGCVTIDRTHDSHLLLVRHISKHLELRNDRLTALDT